MVVGRCLYLIRWKCCTFFSSSKMIRSPCKTLNKKNEPNDSIIIIIITKCKNIQFIKFLIREWDHSFEMNILYLFYVFKCIDKCPNNGFRWASKCVIFNFGFILLNAANLGKKERKQERNENFKTWRLCLVCAVCRYIVIPYDSKHKQNIEELIVRLN